MTVLAARLQDGAPTPCGFSYTDSIHDTYCGRRRMAKRPTTSRTEARDTATASTPAGTSRRPISPTAIDTDREPGRGTEPPISEPPEQTADEDDIRVRAYHRYLERGGGHGADFDDWLEAEKDLKSTRS